MPNDTGVVVMSACRTAIGAFGGTLKGVPAADLGALVVREAITRAGIRDTDVADVILGCVLQAGAGMNIARQAAMKAGLPQDVPAQVVNRVCGSGMQAVISAVTAIRAGDGSGVVAGGVESMSNAPYLLKQARWGYRMGHAEAVDSMISDGLTCAINSSSMGITAEEVANRFDISRVEQDAWAAESQRRAADAIAHGAFAAEIVPVDLPQRKGDPVRFAVDEHPRAGTTVETLAALKPAFRKDGTVTAGNASGINDGAAALVVASEAFARQSAAVPLARILSYACVGVDPAIMGIGPVPAVRRALDRAGLDLSQVDLFEINEAFAAQTIAVVRELRLDAAKVNVYGGGIALGHPIGASGARVLTTLIHALRGRRARYGVATLCIGGGMGIAMVVEAL